MDRKWKKVYFYYDDPYRGNPFNNPRIEGGLPDCLSGREEFTVPHRPNDVFAFCDSTCRKHLYWRNLECLPYDEIPTIIVEVYEKQAGRMNEIDEYIALEEICDEDLAEIKDLLCQAEEAARRAGIIIERRKNE